MSSTIKFANGAEFPLASAPMISGDYFNFSIIPSSTVTSETVYAVVSDYNNTKSFQTGNNGTYGTALTYYSLNGTVSFDGTSINVQFKRKAQSDINFDVLKTEFYSLYSGHLALETAVAILQGGIS